MTSNGLVRRAAGASARRPRATILLWLLLVTGCVVGGALTGTQLMSDSEGGTGESARADERVAAAGLERPASERVLIRSAGPAATRAAATALRSRLERVPAVGAVDAPVTTAGGRTALVHLTLRGDPDDAADRVAPVEAAVAEVARAHPGADFRQAGRGTIDRAFDAMIEEDLERAHVTALPVTLVILLLAFGALVAASVPLLLGLTSVAAAMGALGVVSQLVPSHEAASSLVVVIGLAVGVDYSLFYIRREREERRAGKGPHAALDATAATVGRALVISGLTVIVALAGLLFTGLGVFTAMALATIVVVAIAVVGSVTVLPATLALLGDRVDRGRIPLPRRRGGSTAWGRLARAVTRRPAAALVTAVCLLGALAVPALDLRTANLDASAMPPGEPVNVAQREIERAFPGAPSDAELVVTGRDLDRAALEALGERTLAVTGGRGSPTVDIARDGDTAVVAVPMPDRGLDAAEATVEQLREGEALVTGDAARGADFAGRLSTVTPIVIAAVLGLALLLLVAAFRSPALAGAVVAMNLLSVGAAYGIMVAVFQHDWAEGILDFTSTGALDSWLPLFAFVILFGLSMDYTILVLERIREARGAGRTAREAAAEGVAATAGTVTAAAVVMVAVFGIFATMQFLSQKQLGVGLAAAILLDATLVRGVALPAAVALLGDRRWQVPSWDHARTAHAR